MRRVALVVAAVMALAGCQRAEPPVHGFAGNRILVRIHTADGPVELTNLGVARSPEARARGLMGVESLPEDGGMAFIYDEPSTDAFWMKDTPIPLSIAFFDENGSVIDILDMEPCGADPCPAYRASGPYVGAIEMRLGAFERLGVEVGDTVEYELLSE